MLLWEEVTWVGQMEVKVCVGWACEVSALKNQNNVRQNTLKPTHTHTAVKERKAASAKALSSKCGKAGLGLV